ncbi:hypothetical protein AMTRI_Chr06g196870 [Amborella trichopoda]
MPLSLLSPTTITSSSCNLRHHKLQSRPSPATTPHYCHCSLLNYPFSTNCRILHSTKNQATACLHALQPNTHLSPASISLNLHHLSSTSHASIHLLSATSHSHMPLFCSPHCSLFFSCYPILSCCNLPSHRSFALPASMIFHSLSEKKKKKITKKKPFK